MPGPIIFLIIIIGIVALGVATSLQRKTNEAWQQAAKKLELSFKEGQMFSPPVISGTLSGYSVLITTFSKQHGKTRTTYTRFRLTYSTPLQLGLKLTRQGLLSGFGKFFGSQDIEVGDEGFDGAVIVKGTDPVRVREFLTPSRRLRTARFLTTYSGSVIDDDKIEWNRRHVERNAEKLVRMLQRMIGLADHLTDTPAEDKTMNDAMEARHEGRLADALDLVRGIPTREATDAEDVHVVEGEILLASRHLQEAAEVFEHISKETPEDVESTKLATFAAKPPDQHIHQEAAGSDIDVKSLSETLFDPQNMSSETTAIFDEKYRGNSVRWTGTLVSVRSYTFDLVFGNEPGTRAVVEVCEVGGSYGKRTVQAVVQLPVESEEQIRSQVDKEVTFEGTLVSCDAFMRNLFVGSGRIC